MSFWPPPGRITSPDWSSLVIRCCARRSFQVCAGFTRSSSTATARRRTCRTIADALATLPAESLIVDGEAVVADSRGIPDFGLLHADLAAGRQDRLLYYGFDLLYLDGFDLRGARLAERKRMFSGCWPAAEAGLVDALSVRGRGSD